jgi:hypothetical protein
MIEMQWHGMYSENHYSWSESVITSLLEAMKGFCFHLHYIRYELKWVSSFQTQF